MKEIQRLFVIVLDSLGVGAAPDAASSGAGPCPPTGRWVWLSVTGPARGATASAGGQDLSRCLRLMALLEAHPHRPKAAPRRCQAPVTSSGTASA